MQLLRLRPIWFQVSPVVFALCTLATANAPATAANSPVAERFQFTSSLGPSFVESTHLIGYDDYESGRIKFDPGARLDFGLSFEVIDHLSVGLETGFLVNFTTLQGVGDWTTDAGLYQIPFLGTVTYQIPTGTRLHPFIGAAFGGVDTTLVDYDFWDGESDDDFGLAWQGTVGCRYELSPTMDLGLAYKYLGTTDRTFDRLEAKIDGTRTHSVIVSFSMRF